MNWHDHLIKKRKQKDKESENQKKEKARDRQTDIKSYSNRDREIHHGEKREQVG